MLPFLEDLELDMPDLSSLEQMLQQLTVPTEIALHQPQLLPLPATKSLPSAVCKPQLSPLTVAKRLSSVTSKTKSRPAKKRKQDILATAVKHIRTTEQQPLVETVPAPSILPSTQMHNLAIEHASVCTILDGVREVTRGMMRNSSQSSKPLEERVKTELLTYFVVSDVKKLLATRTDTCVVSIEDIAQTVAAAMRRMTDLQ
jgi:hypothetical protein